MCGYGVFKTEALREGHRRSMVRLKCAAADPFLWELFTSFNGRFPYGITEEQGPYIAGGLLWG